MISFESLSTRLSTSAFFSRCSYKTVIARLTRVTPVSLHSRSGSTRLTSLSRSTLVALHAGVARRTDRSRTSGRSRVSFWSRSTRRTHWTTVTFESWDSYVTFRSRLASITHASFWACTSRLTRVALIPLGTQ